MNNNLLINPLLRSSSRSFVGSAHTRVQRFSMGVGRKRPVLLTVSSSGCYHHLNTRSLHRSTLFMV